MNPESTPVYKATLAILMLLATFIFMEETMKDQIDNQVEQRLIQKQQAALAEMKLAGKYMKSGYVKSGDTDIKKTFKKLKAA